MISKSRLVLIICMLGISCYTWAQKAPEKFGSIELSDLTAKQCSIDSNAHAYYIFDFGKTTFDFPDKRIEIGSIRNNWFKVVFERQFRIKILDNSAVSFADIEIPLYHNEGEAEEISEIKATTYNAEGNTIKTTKLEKSAIIKEKTSENISTIKFPMPNVKEGSVIEVSYTIKSDFVANIQNWQFQHTIPTLRSEYHVSVPEYYSFDKNLKGYVNIDVKNETSSQNLYLELYDRDYYGKFVKQDDRNYSYKDVIYHFTGQNIPAFIVEKYLKTPNTYLSAVEFEINSFQFPNSGFYNYASTWEAVIDNLLSHTLLGEQLNNTAFVKEDGNVLKQSGANGLELLQLAHKYIATKMRWNEKTEILVNTSLRNAFSNGSGNVAEVNLCFIQILRELGFVAHPLLLSTQDHGIINPMHPSRNIFNYLVAVVEWEGNTYLADATEPLSAINMLPIRCLNDKGLLLKANVPVTWIDLTKRAAYKAQIAYKLALDATDLTYKGTIDYNTSEYAAYIQKLKYAKNNTKEKQNAYLEKENPGLTILEADITLPHKQEDKMKEHYAVSIKNFTETAGDLIFFTPLFYETNTENPFKLDRRDYPVEFNFTYAVSYLLILDLPDNVSVDAMPQPYILTLGDKLAKYTYNATQIGNTVQVSSQLSINKTMFLPEEYANLKEFYGQMVAKQNEKIVLKKNQ